MVGHIGLKQLTPTHSAHMQAFHVCSGFITGKGSLPDLYSGSATQHRSADRTPPGTERPGPGHIVAHRCKHTLLPAADDCKHCGWGDWEIKCASARAQIRVALSRPESRTHVSCLRAGGTPGCGPLEVVPPVDVEASAEDVGHHHKPCLQDRVAS